MYAYAPTLLAACTSYSCWGRSDRGSNEPAAARPIKRLAGAPLAVSIPLLGGDVLLTLAPPGTMFELALSEIATIAVLCWRVRATKEV